MESINLFIGGGKLFTPDFCRDNRGYFYELWNQRIFSKIVDDSNFVQDNIIHSTKGVLRGVHTQLRFPQSKVVCCLDGKIYDVLVDCRIGSETFGQWYGEVLSSENRKMLYIPEGVAHGFYTIDDATVLMKVTTHYTPGDEVGFMWDDKTIGIEWPAFDSPLILAEKDQNWGSFDDMIKKMKCYR